MDISPLSTTPVTAPNSQSVVAPGFVTATPSVPDSAPPAATAGKTTDTPQPVSLDHLAQAVKQINDAFTQMGQNLYVSFEQDKATGFIVVKIVDQTTKEIVRQIPSKAMIALAQSLDAQDAVGKLIHNVA